MTGAAPYRWVAFDAVGTLIHPWPPAADVYFETARRFGSRLTRDTIAVRFSHAFRESERLDLQAPGGTGLITSERRERARWRTIVSRVIDDVNDVEGCFCELFAHFAQSSAWRCFDDVAGALQRHSERGFRLAVGSNFDSRLHSACAGMLELSRIERWVVSSEVGFRKPSVRFFDALLAAAGCERDQLLMVGDDRVNDVAAARRAGLAAVHLDRSAATAIAAGPGHSPSRGSFAGLIASPVTRLRLRSLRELAECLCGEAS